MNYFFLILFIFVILYFFLNWFAKISSKKISNIIRLSIIIFSGLLVILMFYAGRYLFSLPFLFAILPLIKTKVGISLLQFIRIWGLLRFLKNSGRFNFNNINQNINNAKNTEKIIIVNLIIFEIFLLDVFANQLRKKYKITKITSIKKK